MTQPASPISPRSLTLIALLFCLLMPFTQLVQAQDIAEPNVSAREILEADKTAEQLEEDKEQAEADGAKPQSTPLNTLLELRKVMRNRELDKFDQFLDRRYLPEEMEQYSSEELMKALTEVFRQQNIINLADISDHSQGNLKDGLPSYREQIGLVTLSTGEVPIYLQRVPDGDGGRIWKLSNATVEHIPQMWEELGYSPLAEYLSDLLPDIKFMGMDNWQLLTTLLAFVVAWPLAAIASFLLKRAALLIPNQFPGGIQSFFDHAMRFFLFILIARLLISQLKLSLTARILLDSSGMDFIAWTVLLMGLFSLLRDYQIRKLQLAGNTQYVALLKPFTSIVKVIAVTIIALYWARTAGYDMSTIIAGLGVGSLAVALAAQKTLENVIGAVTLYTARPVSAGDFCRFGKVVGTVEEIGLRSTLIRTLDRTMLVIPNSVFSSQEIENFSHRDRIRYFRQYRVQLGPAEQLRTILAGAEELLLAHPQLLAETVSVRFETVQDANAVLRLDAGVKTTDFQEYLAIAQDINLQIVEIVQGAGAVFSGPGQLLQWQQAEPGSPEHMAMQETLNPPPASSPG